MFEEKQCAAFYYRMIHNVDEENPEAAKKI
jgi:hypothetical protein